MTKRSWIGKMLDRMTGRAESTLSEEEARLARERAEREAGMAADRAREAELLKLVPPMEEIIIAPATATEKWAAGAFVLDVREPYETAQGIVPAAYVIPLGQIERRIAEIPKNREIVIYCAAGMRSLDAACFLYTRGYGRVYSVDGGVSRWRPS